MSLFWILAATLTLLALALVLPALLKPRRVDLGANGAGVPGKSAASQPAPNADSAQQANLAILREQLVQLDSDLAAGQITLLQHSQNRSEIERRALEESALTAAPLTSTAFAEPHSATRVATRSTRTAIVVALGIGTLAVSLYALLGNPQALSGQIVAANSGANAEGEVTPAQFEAMVEKLAQRLENPQPGQPVDPKAWEMLARTYAAMQRFAQADRAFQRATELAPDNAQLLADHADVLAMLQGQSAMGAPEKLINRALQIDPKNIKALALAGSVAFEKRDFVKASQFWTEARQLAPVGSEFASGLERSLQAAQEAQTGAGPKGAPAAASSISGVVTLAPELQAKLSPNDTVFIFARASDGPRMPLAILRRKASELPISFTLDDSSAMSPDMRLSKFSQVMVGARVSKSGNAMPQSGDLVGQAGPLNVGVAQLAITINAVQP